MGKPRRSGSGCHEGRREMIRRRFVTCGLDAFAPHEILEFLLYYAIPRRDTNPLAHQLMDYYGTLYNVLSAPVSELQKTAGVGERTAVFLSLAFELGQRTRVESVQAKRPDFRALETVAPYFLNLFSGQRYETVCELCLNQKGNLLVCRPLTGGNILSASADTKTLISGAILSGARYVTLAHYYPDGNSEPSPEDYGAAVRIREAFSRVGLELYDHLVIGGGNYVSLRKIGFFDSETVGDELSELLNAIPPSLIEEAAAEGVAKTIDLEKLQDYCMIIPSRKTDADGNPRFQRLEIVVKDI